jgi:uncharacterized repeat protein (TIGR01451 family)/fimbrial isopeptide formation D2 family protein
MIRTAVAAGMLLLFSLNAGSAMAQCSALSPSIVHEGYTELCGGGEITIRIIYPDLTANLTDLVITEDLGTSGMEYVDGSTSFSVRHGTAPSFANPTIIGNQLVWDLGNTYTLEARPDESSQDQFLLITFQLERPDADLEELVSADLDVQASVDFSTTDEVDPFAACSCTIGPSSQALTLYEPNPDVTKRGRNTDAGQGNWTQRVYGHDNDDVIWQVQVTNNGSADLQDLRFDDVMQSGSMDINYICPGLGDATAITDNDGVDPGGTDCLAFSNPQNDYDVDEEFGAAINVVQGGSLYLYLVGKIDATGSCEVGTRTNTVSDVQWGCRDDVSPADVAGGISQTTDGQSPTAIDMETTLYTYYSDRNATLSVSRALTGVNTSQPVGSRGTMTIVIRNYTGGTVKDITLADVLPADYVMDPTFVPTVTMNPRYGDYDGMTDTITWTNQDADPLNNTSPAFTLTSTDANEDYPDQRNMMRDGDVLTVVFRVVLIDPAYYDKSADLDVREESTSDATDPDSPPALTNQLTVEYDTFCTAQGTQTLNFNDTNIPCSPEDLDVDMAGDLIYVLTGDPDQTLPLTVNVTNNGGHDADDYVLNVTFGVTMDVTDVPTGCAVTTNPPTLEEWQDPAGIPSTAAVYECTGGTIAPGQTRAFEFGVIKATSAAAVAADDLTFRADVTGQINLADGTALTFPAINVPARSDGGDDVANNYSLDGLRARVIGFNLTKELVGTCSENNPPIVDTIDGQSVERVEIGEECTFHIETGGWFGFQTPGFTLIAVQDITVWDQLPDGQGYILGEEDSATTSAIAGVSLNPSTLNAPNEVSAPDYLNWTFNWTDALQISEKDHWFRANVTSRILNDALNSSAAPNVHAAASTNLLVSTFQAVFESDVTGDTVTYLLGPSTLGYPSADVRQVRTTVTEPDIIVVKEVCNETLNGTGPSCSDFVSLASDGDAYDSYIYRLTVTNTAASDGYAHSPAYDVTVTDTLAAADLAYVLPFDADGLDNDGDGSTDEAGEGTISDNTVANGTPPVLTFSHTHSTALERIDAGTANAVQLFYRVDFDDDAAPLQTFTNSAVADYDTLEGDSGNQSDYEGATGEAAGARSYTSPAGTADVRILPVETRPKEITALSNTPIAGSGTQGVSVGEEIEYELTTSLPVALLRDFVIRDELPEGLMVVEAPDIDLTSSGPHAAAGFVPGGVITPTVTDDYVQWDLGDQRVTNGTVGTRYELTTTFIARVENIAGNNDGDLLENGDPATAAYTRYVDEGANTVQYDFGQVDVAVQEPTIVLTKAFAVADADAADVLTVTVTAENTGTATAYNLRVWDNLDGLELTYLGNEGGDDPPDSVDTATFGANQPVFVWGPANGIPAGDTFSFTFEVQVDDTVQPEEILDNTLQADWTSLPEQTTALNSGGSIGADGSATGMRIGALPNAGDALNDYETTADAQTSVPAPTMTKDDLDPTVVPTIGARKQFRIEVSLPEGVTNGVTVTDDLDATGLSFVLENNTDFDITYTFQDIDTINGLSPDETAFNAFPADGSTGDIVWDIGTVVTVSEDDTTANIVAPAILIDYWARINNDTETDNGDSLQNGAAVTYDHGETGDAQTLTDDTPVVTVLEPLLDLGKSWSNVSPGKAATDPPEGGDILQYVLVVLNSGTSTAWDVNIVDTLPASLTFYDSFTPTALIDAAAVAGFVATPANTPGGPLIWGHDNGDDSLDIPSGETLVLTYQTVVTAAGGDISNSVMVDWTSLDGDSDDERDGEGCPSITAPDDYCAGPAVASVSTVDNNSIDKEISADTFDTASWSTADDAVARVGDIITYRLAANLSGGLTGNLRIEDELPSGMVFIETVSINTDTAAPYEPPASGAGSNFSYASIPAADTPTAGQTGTLTWTIGDVVNDPFGDATTDAIEIVYLARVEPDSGIAHTATTDLTNTVSMDYETTSGPAATQTDTAVLTVVQPVLTVAKTAVADGGDTVLAADELITYTVDIVNSGGAPAYDPLLTDTLPVGVRDGVATITTVSMELLSGTSLPVLDPVYDAATGLVTWTFDTGTADAYTIPAGDTLRIVYQVQAETDLGAGMTLTNEAQVQQYESLDDEDIPAAGSATGEAQTYGPTNVASVTFTTDAPDALTKENPADPVAAVGELFAYTITVPATPSDTALHDVRILDDLTASAAVMHFVSVAKVYGIEPWTPENTGTDTNLVIEDTTIGIDIPAGEQVIVEITVMLDDDAANTDGLTFSNTASYTYDQIDDDPATQMPGGGDTTDDMTVVGVDDLTLEKSGPATVQLGTPATYTLDFHNTSSGRVWNPTLTDLLPDGADGGMCVAGPSNVTAEIFEADGTTSVSGPLVEGTDFTVTFDSGACQWTFTLLSAAGGVAADNRLIVTYEVSLDSDTVNGTSLTNVAGVTQWYSADPDVSGGSPHCFTYTLTDGTTVDLDYEDSHTATAEAPILEFEMSVVNVTTGQDPGSDATPGDTLQYTIEITNTGPVGLSDFTVVDDLGDLNAELLFASGTLTLVTVPTGADTFATDAAGGTYGSGLVSISALEIGAAGDANDTITIVYTVELASVITNGTTVLNQAQIPLPDVDPVLSDDPYIVAVDTDPTETLITSAPEFEVLKTATPLEGDLTVLMAGEMLRYTLTIKNIGNENAVQVTLQDYIPANTTYVANSTTLNGTSVADTTPGVCPLESGMLIYAPENPTPGEMRADTDPAATNTATVTFDVLVDADVMDGLIIENQGFVNGDGEGSGTQPEQPSDDPATDLEDDPTQIVVGNLPLLYGLKTVEILEDYSSTGIVDPTDVLLYTIVISNFGAIPATDVVLIDTVPDNTTYVADSLTLNGVAVGSDGGILPLIAGLTVQSDDNPGDGIISAGGSAVVTFAVRVNDDVAVGTVISNQGSIGSTELSEVLTDSDGVSSNGYQPTVVVVGDVQMLEITKEVVVAGEGAAEAGTQLEYTIRVNNVGSVPATQVVVYDDLESTLGELVTYVEDSGLMNGSADGVTYSGGILTADYGTQYGDLPSGESIVVRFCVQINDGIDIGTDITNTGVVNWDDPRQSVSASVSLAVGGTPGSISMDGYVWHDANLDFLLDADTESVLEGWSVGLYRNGELVSTELTDADGYYRFYGLVPNGGTAIQYELRFRSAGATENTPSLGWGDSSFTNGPQFISDISGISGAVLQNLNLPLWPNGIVYDSVVRQPVAGAGLALLNAATGEALPEGCFDDPVQQNQVTATDGFYKFDLNFSEAACPAGDAYLIEVTPPETGYSASPSEVIPPASDETTEPFSVPACPGSTDDAIDATDEYCEVLSDVGVPSLSVLPRSSGTRYYLHLLLDDGLIPGHSQVFNNPIPIDPTLDGAVSITKTCSMVNVSRGDLVPYTITISNIYGTPLYDIGILDRFPAGFKYVSGSARLDGESAEPEVNGRSLLWDDIELGVNEKHTLRLLLVVGSGVSEGEYVNRAQAVNTEMDTAVSEEATATVLVVPDPDFDCTDVIGKVFDDSNLDGIQDSGEEGLSGVRVVTARGLIATTDEYGRFHITCAAVPDEDRGSNFILKLDERSLPTGYRLTTENPRVQRATRGKMLRFNFGAAIHRVVRLDIADGVFEPDTSDLRLQWLPKIDQLMEELKKAPSVLRLSYLGDVETEGLVERRLDALKKEIDRQWDSSDGGYQLTIETEVYWRRGAPVAGQ